VIAGVDLLACPLTGLRLREATLEAAEAEACEGQKFTVRSGGPQPLGRTPTVLLREDGRAAYPVISGIPVLLAPEQLAPPDAAHPALDLRAPQYAEAYEEMDFYNAVAQHQAGALASADLPRLSRITELSEAELRRFPEPAALWLDATYETTAQWDAYRHLAPVAGTRILQLGGKGEQAVEFLLAGAAEAWVVSPMVGELLHAAALARRFGVEDRLRCAAGVAEELPLRTAVLDRIWGKSMHHTVEELSYPQCARALRAGGRMAAVEPWRALLYSVGTHALGKREREVHCRPLTDERVQPFLEAFPSARVVHHGPILRYPLLALEKFGVKLSLRASWRVARVDDRLGSLLPGFRNAGSCATLLAEASA
jgi:uncharacterized protein YbaR (Trm112 family)